MPLEEIKWSENDDNILKQAVNLYGVHKWGAISSLVVGRSPRECRERWIRVLQYQQGGGAIDNKRLLELYSLFGDAWDVISSATSLSPILCKSRVYSLLGLESSSDDLPDDLSSDTLDNNPANRQTMHITPVRGSTALHQSDTKQHKTQPISNCKELASARQRDYVTYLKHKPKKRTIRNIHCSHSRRRSSLDTATKTAVIVVDYKQYIRSYIDRNRIRLNASPQQGNEAVMLRGSIINTRAVNTSEEKYYPPVSLYSIYAKMSLSQPYTVV